MQEFILLIIGLIGLWFGTNLVIKGALNIANYYELSQVFVGIAILSIGTDLPELIISIDASIQSAVFDVFGQTYMLQFDCDKAPQTLAISKLHNSDCQARSASGLDAFS